MLEYARLHWAGEAAITVELGEAIAPATNDRVLALVDILDARALPGVIEIVPAYRSATIYFDPLLLDGDEFADHLRSFVGAPLSTRLTPTKTVEIPVCYGGDAGPDLAEVARLTGHSPAEVVAFHHSVAYRVYLLGFSPGFPYLGSVPETIRVSRLAEPRTRVRAGSVAIAGEQCGIYPVDSPGGWRVIGRTPRRLFDPSGAQPFLLSPGDHVRFVPIDRQTFVQSGSSHVD